MTAVETIREAARLMRINATDADDGHRWVAVGSHVDTDPECGLDAGTSLLSDHIANLDPTVALAVADWLDHEATLYEEAAKINARISIRRKTNALNVARTYLRIGDDS